MRTVKWNAFLSGLCGFAVVLGVMATSARADVTTEEGASILVFPKIVVDGTGAPTDTIIQITNTDNSAHGAHCYYVDASLRTSDGGDCTIPSSTCLPVCAETDFFIWLTKKQPTHWLVSKGRSAIPSQIFGADGSGFPPGHIPPMPSFRGELKCIETTDDGLPSSGNHLIGEATIKTTSGVDAGDVSKHNAIGVRWVNTISDAPSNPLLLNGSDYDACPAKLILNHSTTGASDPVASQISGLTSSVTTDLTLVPCGEDFENQRPTSVTAQFLIINKFEQRFSASTTISCYLTTELTKIDSPTRPNSSVFSEAVLGSDIAQTEITPVTGNGALIGVAERTVSAGSSLGNTRSARAAYDLHTEGDNSQQWFAGVSMAHIHSGAPGENGDVVVTLYDRSMDGAIGRTFVKRLTADDTDLGALNDLIASGGAYINVHTDANPDGEIRGQAALPTSEAPDFALSGTEEVPPVDTTARGRASVSVDLGVGEIIVTLKLVPAAGADQIRLIEQ